VDHELAQVNIARLKAPLDTPLLADFVAALDPVNASADRTPGFVWRLQDDGGNATSIEGFKGDVGTSAGVIVNLSTWRSLDELGDWVYGDMHRTVLRQRHTWFERVAEATNALWWVASGHRPTVPEAEERLRHLREHGPTPFAFSMKTSFPAPQSPTNRPIEHTRADWICGV
jgi:hypothetical protein